MMSWVCVYACLQVTLLHSVPEALSLIPFEWQQ